MALGLIAVPFAYPSSNLPFLASSLGFSILALLTTITLIPVLQGTFLLAELKGKDLLKRTQHYMCVSKNAKKTLR